MVAEDAQGQFVRPHFLRPSWQMPEHVSKSKQRLTQFVGGPVCVRVLGLSFLKILSGHEHL